MTQPLDDEWESTARLVTRGGIDNLPAQMWVCVSATEKLWLWTDPEHAGWGTAPAAAMKHLQPQLVELAEFAYPVLRPLLVLRGHGHPESIKVARRRIHAGLREILAATRTLPCAGELREAVDFTARPPRRAFKDPLAYRWEVLDHLRGLRDDQRGAARALAQLEEQGFRFDEVSGHVHFQPANGRPRTFYRDLVGKLCAVMSASGERKEYMKRRAISLTLEPYFPQEYTEASPKGKLARSMYHAG